MRSTRKQLIIGGNFDGTPRWSRDLDQYIAIDEALCGQCDIADIRPALLLERRPCGIRALYGGRALSIVPTAQLRRGRRQSSMYAQLPHAEFYAELTEFFYGMLEHYDHVIGVLDTHSD